MSTTDDGTTGASGMAEQQAKGLLGSDVREGYAEIGDQRLHYVEVGEGPLIVLLHGFPEFWYGWRQQIRPLAAAGFRVVAPDTRGYNLSSKPNGVKAYDTGLLAADIRGLIHERGAETAMLVGHDWGRTIAWTTAMNHPEVVDRLAILNRSSAQVLAFVARRLQAESVVLLFAERKPGELDELAGLPDLLLRGLPGDSARELLASAISGPLDDRVRARILAEARGNPLALLELPHESSPATLAGGFGLPGALPLPGRIEASFRRRAQQLPAATQRLLLVAAAEPTGEPILLWRAAGTLGIPAEAAGPAQSDGLLDLGAQVAFRHPLLRSAIYRAAAADERRSAHVALAAATDAETDPDRRAWHRAHATVAPDEDVADELERSAGRAQARGGLAAAAAFLERAAALTPDPGRRARRALYAARAKQLAGAPARPWRFSPPPAAARWATSTAPCFSACTDR